MFRFLSGYLATLTNILWSTTNHSITYEDISTSYQKYCLIDNCTVVGMINLLTIPGYDLGIMLQLASSFDWHDRMLVPTSTLNGFMTLEGLLRKYRSQVECLITNSNGPSIGLGYTVASKNWTQIDLGNRYRDVKCRVDPTEIELLKGIRDGINDGEFIVRSLMQRNESIITKEWLDSYTLVSSQPKLIEEWFM